MVTRIFSAGFKGLDAYPVEIEVDVQRGLPAVTIIGLVDTQVKESRDRVRSSLKNTGYSFPSERIVINLAPANVKKEGTQYDLAIALGILSSSHQVQIDFSSFIIVGELSLEGKVRGVKGVFPMALCAQKQGKKLLVPLPNAREAGLVQSLQSYAVKNLSQAVSCLAQRSTMIPVEGNLESVLAKKREYDVDFSDVKGQVFAKRALEAAVSGMHNCIMIGSPGVGKTMLARRIPTILPDMAVKEIMEVTKIHSIAGILDQELPLVKERVFRAPHHTCSSVALVGGGTSVKPGEVTLAHNGVLFLDELPEFSRDALEALRQPIEDGFVSISRASGHMKFPSRFLLVSAMNPCPCGFFGSLDKSCRCSSLQVQKYRQKISGPLLDRIDIHIELHNVQTKALLQNEEAAETSEKIKARVNRVRDIQFQRYKNEKIHFNAQLKHRQIKKFCPLTIKAQSLLAQAVEQLKFSARSYDKIIKVARTIADMDASVTIKEAHIAEAVRYRSLDKTLWI